MYCKNSRRNHRTRRLRIEKLEDRRVLAAVTVGTISDVLDWNQIGGIPELINNPGADNIISLREAIIAANQTFDGTIDTIDFAPAITGDNATILLTNGDLLVTDDLTITGPGKSLGDPAVYDLVLSGNNSSRIFDVLNTSFEMRGLKLTDGDEFRGGAIRSEGSDLIIRDSEISGNQAFSGGGLHINGNGNQIEIEDSTISTNYAEQVGGGLQIGVVDESQVIIRSSTISENVSGTLNGPFVGSGGGMHLSVGSFSNDSSTAEIIDSNIIGNLVRNFSKVPDPTGGGIDAVVNEGLANQLTISRSTISDNQVVGAGGGISLTNHWQSAVTENVLIINSTVSGNKSANNGGGIHLTSQESSAGNRSTSRIAHSTIVFNEVGHDAGGLLTTPTITGGGLRINGNADTGETYTVLDHTIVSDNVDLEDVPNDPLDANTPDIYIFTGAPSGPPATQTIEAPYSLLGDVKGGCNSILCGDGIEAGIATGSGVIFGSSGVDPTLANNGGPTLTHIPLAGSLAIDAGDPAATAGVGDIPEFDQRGSGFTRVFDWIPGGTQIDIGAVELGVSDSTPPTITDVILNNVDNPAVSGDTEWTGKAPVHFATRVVAGEQHRSIAATGVDTLQIEFSENVVFASGGNELDLRVTTRAANGDPMNDSVPHDDFSLFGNLATWTFDTPLADGKYAIHLNVDLVTDAAGNQLDGEYDNPTGTNGSGQPTLDDHTDDPTPLTFSTGDGTEGSTDSDGDGSPEFRFHFALLAGDYDGDGALSGEDFLLWQQEEDATGDPVNVADGNGDGNVDAVDRILWEDGFALDARLALWIDSLDMLDDDFIDEQDNATWLLVWTAAFGSQVGDPNYNVLADLNQDGDVSGADFLLANTRLGDFTFWHTPFALALPASTIGTPPQVMNVMISGSVSEHDPFSFDTVDGSGSQLNTVPVGGADTISIVFSEGVNVSAASLMVVGLTSATLPSLAEFSYDVSTNTGTWRFEGWTLGDQYVLSLSDSVTDVDGNRLDGEWTNPASITTTNTMVSEFPSGDGNAGGRFNFIVTLLPGDANLDGVVDTIDATILFSNYGTSIDAVFNLGDFDGDGDIDTVDFTVYLNTYGTNLQNVWILADFDGDSEVDGDDLAVISGNIGMTGATWADGDLNGDGQVTLEDLDLAFAQFGLDLDVVA